MVSRRRCSAFSDKAADVPCATLIKTKILNLGVYVIGIKK